MENLRVTRKHCPARAAVRLAGMGLVLAFLVCLAIPGDSAFAAPKKGGTFRATIPTDMTQPDLHKTSAQIDNGLLGMNVYETLFTFDKKFNIKPFLCKSYTYSADGLTLTLNLRQGVKFHNGAEMKAEDVKFSLDRCRDASIQAFHANNLKPVKEVKVTGPYQVQITLTKLMPDLLYFLATGNGTIAMMSKKDLEASGNKVTRPVGTGPYKFVTWERDSKIILERFDGYSSADGPIDGLLGKRNIYFDKIVYYVMKEPATRIMALDRGDVDWVSVLPYQQIDDLKKKKDIKVETGQPLDGGVWYGFYVNFNHPVLSKPDFRKAMAYALNRKEIAKAAVWGYGVPSFSIIPLEHPAHSASLDKTAPNYDPAKAKEYLKKSGYRGERIKILTSKNYTPMYDQVVAAQAMWAAVGINTDIEVVDWATHLARWRKGEHEILSFAPLVRYDPAANTMYLSKTNFFGYKNEKTFALHESLEKTNDSEKRNEIYRKLYDIVIKDAVVMVNFYIDSSFAFKPYVKGFESFDHSKGRIWNFYFDK